jgi:hypothetical protein
MTLWVNKKALREKANVDGGGSVTGEKRVPDNWRNMFAIAMKAGSLGR